MNGNGRGKQANKWTDSEIMLCNRYLCIYNNEQVELLLQEITPEGEDPNGKWSKPGQSRGLGYHLYRSQVEYAEMEIMWGDGGQMTPTPASGMELSMRFRGVQNPPAPEEFIKFFCFF